MKLPGFERWGLQRELRHLYPLADAARQEGRFVAEQPLREQILLLAERLGDLDQLIPARYRLGWTLRMRGEFRAALPLFTWLTGLASDPVLSRQVQSDQAGYIADAFGVVARLTLALDDGSAAQALAILDEGLAWVARIGHPELAAMLRLERSGIHQRLEAWDAARRDMEIALALRRRYPTGWGYTEGAHLVNLAELYVKDAVGDHAEAIALVEDARTRERLTTHFELRGLRVLVRARRALGDLPGALEAAREALGLACGMDNPSSLAAAWNLLSEVARQAGQLDEAADAAAGSWWAAHAHACATCTCGALISGVRVRAAQGRVAATSAPVGASGPAAPTPAARRYLAAARRLLARAVPLAADLDTPAHSQDAQKELAEARAEVNALATALAVDRT